MLQQCLDVLGLAAGGKLRCSVQGFQGHSNYPYFSSTSWWGLRDDVVVLHRDSDCDIFMCLHFYALVRMPSGRSLEESVPPPGDGSGPIGCFRRCGQLIKRFLIIWCRCVSPYGVCFCAVLELLVDSFSCVPRGTHWLR